MDGDVAGGEVLIGPVREGVGFVGKDEGDEGVGWVHMGGLRVRDGRVVEGGVVLAGFGDADRL